MGLNEVRTAELKKSCQRIPAYSSALGLYLHVPFCSRPCDFCAFFQVQTDREGILHYIDGIRREIELVACDQEIDTCFCGGGTPSLLPANDLLELGNLIVDGFGQPRKEWTVEMAPSSVKADKLRVLKDLGVNRVSLGVQSFDDGLLEALGRPHTHSQAMAAYELIRNQEFESVNVDLMFALPGQNRAALKEDLNRAVALNPDHISTYCLTFEEDTVLYVKLSEGKVSIDSDLEAEHYEIVWEQLGEAGYEQYEISNYAKPGKQCLHNINTWRMNDWIGLGPSAASQFRGVRSANPSDLNRWQEDLESGERSSEDSLSLTEDLLLEDSVIFGFRMNEGIDFRDLSTRFKGKKIDALRSRLDAMLTGKLILREGEQYFLSEEGRLVADAIGAEIMSFA